MRVVVNGIPLLGPRSGVGNYLYETFSQIVLQQKEWDISFYYGSHRSSELQKLPAPSYLSTREAVLRKVGRVYPIYRTILDLLFFFQQMTRTFDLYHETNFIPMRFSGPTVLTVFDLSFHLFPETHPPERIQYMKRYFYPRLGRVSHFITISESVKREMVKYLPISSDKISVTPLGVNPHFRSLSFNLISPVLAIFGLNAGRYILSVGTLEPRKNIRRLLNSYASLPNTLRRRHPLVLTGGVGWLVGDIDGEIERLGIARTTIKTGVVSVDQLVALYNGAMFFVYPSLYEGFGLPPLEAMACGTPVITSNSSSLPEVVGDAGILIDPLDVKTLTEKMEDLLTNTELRASLSAKGIERAKKFTWESCAKKTLDVYKKVS